MSIIDRIIAQANLIAESERECWLVNDHPGGLLFEDLDVLEDLYGESLTFTHSATPNEERLMALALALHLLEEAEIE